jgi:phospholipase/lecithinase/hemolysin
MKRLSSFVIGILLFGLVVHPAHAAFKSLYVFGDALSATADGTGALYYAGRDSNGRVWVEVLAQRQGLTYNATNNNSYYDHNSAITITDVKNFTAPADVASDLFIVWVCNADTFDAAQAPDNSTQWQAAINQAQTNHLQIITNLYAKGVRTLILPNVVDISEIPAFNAGTTLTGVEHAGCVAYNVAFSNTIKQARALCPGLKIYTPDFFTLLNNVLTNAAAYGLTNALSSKGFSIDALTALYANAQTVPLNGPGTNYIFWDNQDPTAKFHEVIADVVQQSISPVQISQITVLTGSNRLDMTNVPVGLNGFVDGSTNLAPSSWTTVTNWGTTNLVTITSTNTTQSIFFLAPPLLPIDSFASGSGGSGGPPPPGGGSGTGAVSGTNLISATQFYRLRFPYAWTWP